MVAQAETIWQSGLEALAPPERLTVSQWAERHLWMSPRFTAYPGKFRLDRTPYLREPLDAFGDSNVAELTICSAAQVAKTTFLKACLGYAVDQDPGPLLLVLPNQDLCKSFSEQRLRPFLEDCPRLKRHLPEDPRKFRLLEIPFTNNVQLALVGANSPANLASRPVRDLLLDEIDKYPRANEREAGAVALAEKRVRTFFNSKLLKTSTPTNTNGEIWLSFLKGDQRFYWVACPHCQHEQPLVFGDQSILPDRYGWEEIGRVAWSSEAKRDLVWDLELVRRSAYYECGHCKGRIENKHKPEMVRRGEWRPEATTRTHRSYQLSALYALWKSCSWGELAVEFLEAKAKGQDGLQDFCNSTLGEPWEVRGDAADESEILAHRLAYKRGECPVDPVAVLITADLQKSSVYYVVRAWGPHLTSYKLDYGILQNLDQLAAVGRRVFQGLNGKDILPTNGALDSGDQTDKVYQFCQEHNWTPVKGWRDRNQPFQWGPGFGGKLLNVDSSYYKDSLQVVLFNDPGTPGSWNLPSNTGEEYATHLTAEAKIREVSKKDGRVKWVWHQLRENNHWLDCEVYQLALAQALGVEHMTPGEAKQRPKPQPRKRRDGRDWWER